MFKGNNKQTKMGIMKWKSHACVDIFYSFKYVFSLNSEFLKSTIRVFGYNLWEAKGWADVTVTEWLCCRDNC